MQKAVQRAPYMELRERGITAAFGSVHESGKDSAHGPSMLNLKLP